MQMKMQKNELSTKDFEVNRVWYALRKNDIKIKQEKNKSI